MKKKIEIQIENGPQETIIRSKTSGKIRIYNTTCEYFYSETGLYVEMVTPDGEVAYADLSNLLEQMAEFALDF
jgi:hypothetical protein